MKRKLKINTINNEISVKKTGIILKPEQVAKRLAIGSSCSALFKPYLDEWNKASLAAITISFIDPYNWAFDLQDNRVGFEEKITSLETDLKYIVSGPT